MAIGFKNGYVRKKEGASVYYINQNVKGKVKQASRAYQSVVNNPKTLNQSRHRALFVACKNFRRGFEGLLNHSWQGTKYGIPSLNRFTQLVMTKDSAQFPGVYLQPKNSMKFIPQRWPLSTGSLFTQVNFEPESLEGAGKSVVTDIIGPDAKYSEKTKGDFWKGFLKANPSFADGDMITFCIIVQDPSAKWDEGKEIFAPVFDRFVINTNDKSVMESVDMITQNGHFLLKSSKGEQALLIVENAPFRSIVAAGAIVSRRSPIGTSYLRNNSILQVAKWIDTYYNSDTYRENCIRSFMDDSFLESSWYLNQVGYDAYAQGGNNWQNGNNDDTTIEEP